MGRERVREGKAVKKGGHELLSMTERTHPIS